MRATRATRAPRPARAAQTNRDRGQTVKPEREVVPPFAFRRSVGLCIFSRTQGNKVFAARRRDDRSGSWQLPQVRWLVRYLIRPPVIARSLSRSLARVTLTTYIGRTTISTTTVQGGIDPPENPLMAAHRELEEETGIRKELVRVVTSLDAWLDYEHPTFSQGVEYRGQTQKWVLLEFLGGDEDVDLCHLGEDAREFEEWRWMRLEEVADGVVWFKKGVYREVYERFGAYLL